LRDSSVEEREVTELFGIAATAVLFGLFGYMGSRRSWRFDGCDGRDECGDCGSSCSLDEGAMGHGGGKASAWWPVDDVRHGEQP
jgi:hypothetical protein